jgi:predicted MFS family arabinose efflux permease
MLMVGAAIGPILGGTLANGFGYDSLALAGGALGALGGACLALIARLRPVSRENACENP